MGLKYNKNDGQLLTSALDHNLQVADQIISDLQEGVNRLTSYMDDPFGDLSGKAYNAANTLFKSIIQPTLSKLKSATADVKGDLNSYKYAISAFDRYNDTVYDKEEIERTLDIKRQQKALVENQIRFFNDMLVGGLAKSAVENLQFEGKQLESVLNHYEEEIKKQETKLQILEETAWQTSSLFQDSLQVFQSALQGAKALKTGRFDSHGNFSMSSSSDLSWYKKITGKDISRDLLHEPSHLTASDIEEQEVANMNAETKAQLEQIALATGLTLAQVIAMYAKASKKMAIKGGEIIHNVWDFISDEFGKLSPENRVKDGDVIKTIIYYTNQGNLKVIYNETQNVVLEAGGGSFMDNLANFNGISGTTEKPKGVEYVGAWEGNAPAYMQGQTTVNGYADTVKGTADSVLDTFGFKGSYHSEEQAEMTGKEYLDKVSKEKERKRQEEAIKAQQKISGGGNPATLGS